MNNLLGVLIFGSILVCSFAVQAQINCSLTAGSLPHPTEKVGREDFSNPVRHIIVIMQENHSFDNYFGNLNTPEFYGSQIDGLTSALFNMTYGHQQIFVHHEASLCVADPDHDWNAMHYDWHSGLMDGFVRQNSESGDGSRALGYYTADDLPFYYGLANAFTVGDRYFSSVLGPTLPNRFFLMAGTAFGHIGHDFPKTSTEYSQKTIFDILSQNKITWKYYSDAIGHHGKKGYLALFQPMYEANKFKMKSMADYERDLSHGALPQVSFIDASFDGEDEHPEGDVQLGQAWTANKIRLLMSSPYWKNSVLFLTYDESGGFYDHVSPPPACKPDTTEPHLFSDSESGSYNQYGFRVPFVAVSPFAKHHYVTHGIYDHTSLLKYIETKFNLPSLTSRDANADPFTDVFDYDHPDYSIPDLPSEDVDHTRLCK